MHTIKMLVTTDQAKSWLDQQNNKNRTLSKPRAAAYAADMLAGNWQQTHQGIAFYQDGNLADGQHRLAAIMLSGVSVEMLVTFGLEPKQAAGIDAHRARATIDVVKITGLADWVGKNEAAIAKMVRRLPTLSGGTPTSSQIVAFCNLHREALEFVAHAMPSAVRFLSAAPIRTAIFCAYGHVDNERLAWFCRVLYSGIVASTDDVAAIRLRERLLADGRQLQAGETGRALCAKLTMRAIKAFCDREQISKLQTPKDYLFPPPAFE